MQNNGTVVYRFLMKLVSIVFCFLALLMPSWANVDANAQAASPKPQSKEDDAPPNLKPIEDVANAWLKRPELQHSLVGLEIMHIPSATVLFSHNGRRRFVPASTTKVYSTACAMDTFGPNYTFNTKLKVYGKIVGNKLEGSLYIDPSQDPTLKTADLRELLSVLQAKGIKTIEGKVDVVGIPGGGDRFCSYWLLEDWGQDWMPVPSDLVVDGNIAHRDPARGYPLVSFSIARGQNAFLSSLLTSNEGPSWVCFHPDSKTMQYWHPAGAAVGGQIVGNPNDYNVAIAATLIKQMGIKIKEKAISQDVLEAQPIVLAEHNSRPLSEIVKFCLKESDNLYAQQLLRALGTLPPVSKNVEKMTLEEKGLARLNQWLASINVPPGDVLLWDGCGLSRKDCFTPHALNLVHRHMAGAQLKSAYLDVMPLDGAAGATNGTFRYKTGTMDSVRSISGVLITAAGEPLAVTAMVNAHNPSIRDVRASMAGMINHLQGLGSLRYAPLPVTPAVIPKKTPGASASAKHPAGSHS
ncbi:MAG: D-alanyl-D-alanine carboxypeptidase, partial [Candidatus Obscuribacterales bacterium]|nr:D-alanyl-D-alanine carboxypeptidase [Candidatus Obscuribacterales bacterium]